MLICLKIIYQEKQLEVIRSKTWINGRNLILEISKSKENTEIIDTLNKDEKQMANIFIKNIVKGLFPDLAEEYATTDLETVKSFIKERLKIRKRVKDPDWWYATRAMSAFALVVAEAIDAKYIVPTDIAMVYGILEKNFKY